MPKPVITTTSSVLSFQRWEDIFFQPDASNVPTSWAATGLPPGLALNTATGLISGVVTAVGEANIRLTASNADGPSDPVLFALGVRDGAASNGPDVDLDWDLVTGQVTLPGLAAEASAANGPVPLLRPRFTNVINFSVRVRKLGVTIDVAPLAFALGIKADDGEPLVDSSTAWHKYGTGAAARYVCAVAFDDAPLKAAIDAHEEPEEAAGPDEGVEVKTALLGLCSLKLVFPNPHAADFPTVPTLRFDSDTFRMEIARDICA